MQLIELESMSNHAARLCMSSSFLYELAYLVIRSIEDIMQRYCQLHHAKRRPQMTCTEKEQNTH